MLIPKPLTIHLRGLKGAFPSLHSLSYRWSARTETFNLCAINGVGIQGLVRFDADDSSKSFLVEANLKQHEVNPVYNCASSWELNLFLRSVYFGQTDVTVTL